jgi:EF hand
MSDTPEGEIHTITETEYVDVDGDGTVDAMRETTTHLVDVDGDGTIDIVQHTVTTAYDLTGDGQVDLVESTTVTGVDVDGDGEFSDDEISVEGVTIVSEEVLDEG